MSDLNTIGVVLLFNGTTAPEGWMFCEGQELTIASNNALAGLIGHTYGGSSNETFCLPKRSNVGTCRYIICTKGYSPQRG